MGNREQELNQALEAMHFGFRAMVFRPDQTLEALGLSRVHHRLLYFIGRHPQCSVSELLDVLKVSKQYLNRPLRELLQQGFVSQQADANDRRIKRLSLTAQGASLEDRLTGPQRDRFEEVFRQAGPEAEQHWRDIMQRLAGSLMA